MIRDTSPAEYHIDNLIDECSYILSGKCGNKEQQRIDDLMDEMRGFAFQMRCTNAACILSDRSRNGGKRMAEGELRNVDAAIARHERHRQRDEHRNRNGKCHRQDGRESRARVSAFPGRQRRA